MILAFVLLNGLDVLITWLYGIQYDANPLVAQLGMGRFVLGKGLMVAYLVGLCLLLRRLGRRWVLFYEDLLVTIYTVIILWNVRSLIL